MSAANSKKVLREKPIPEYKKELVDYLVKRISERRTVLIASCKGLPGQQFHEIKKKLRGKAEIKVAKKSSINRAINEIDKGAIKNLKEKVGADIVVLFSDLDPFELSGILTENQSPAKVKPGDVAPEDIEIEPGPTDLLPGPAISELGSVGLKVSVKDGKLEIMKGAVVVKKGEKVKNNVASVLGKLDISPMKVGFRSLAAYDSQEDKIYFDIVIDKEGTLEELRNLIEKALGFAVNVNYSTKETISYFIAKASAEEKVLSEIIKEKTETPIEEETPEKKEEEKIEEKGEQKSEEKKESLEKNIQKDTKEEK